MAPVLLVGRTGKEATNAARLLSNRAREAEQQDFQEQKSLQEQRDLWEQQGLGEHQDLHEQQVLRVAGLAVHR